MIMTTLQAQMKAKLEQAGIPYREVKCYGQQVMITALSRSAAVKWAGLLRKFCGNVRRPYEGIYYTAHSNRYPNEKRYHTISVWRVWATI